MDRKEFLKRSLWVCGGCGAVATLGATGAGASEGGKPASECEALEKQSGFVKGWVGDFVANLDATLEEKDRVALMHANGRACARRGSLESMRKFEGDLDGLVTEWRSWFGEESAARDGNTLTLSWGECLCPVAKDGPDRMDTWCHCSEGWVHEVFGMITGKEVGVEFLETVKRGGERCRIRVRA